MPYKVMPHHPSCPISKPYAVTLRSDSAKVMGCHSTKESAEKQIAAIHANEDK